MKTLIVGYGQIGKALNKVLADYNPTCLDVNDSIDETFEIIHICFGYSEDFIWQVREYQAKYRPKYTVIHSTVPVGTSEALNASHSPIRGIHPHLEHGIRTFVKFLGGPQASEIADYFRRVGLKIMLFDKSQTTEAMKLFDTEYYRACIEFTQRVKKYCDSHNLNFHEVYTLANQTYNEGYKELNHPEFIRPVLQPILTPIGGHCVVPNSKLIDDL